MIKKCWLYLFVYYLSRSVAMFCQVPVVGSLSCRLPCCCPGYANVATQLVGWQCGKAASLYIARQHPCHPHQGKRHTLLRLCHKYSTVALPSLCRNRANHPRVATRVLTVCSQLLRLYCTLAREPWQAWRGTIIFVNSTL